mgnify:CR=1 FL=1
MFFFILSISVGPAKVVVSVSARKSCRFSLRKNLAGRPPPAYALPRAAPSPTMTFCVPPEWFERRNLKFKFMNTSVTSASSARVAHQQGLNRVVADRVRHLVEHRAPAVQQTLQRMIVESAQLQDYLHPISAQ